MHLAVSRNVFGVSTSRHVQFAAYRFPWSVNSVRSCASVIREVDHLKRRRDRYRDLLRKLRTPSTNSFFAHGQKYSVPYTAELPLVHTTDRFDDDLMRNLGGYFDSTGCVFFSQKLLPSISLTKSSQQAERLLQFANLFGGHVFSAGCSRGVALSSVQWSIKGKAAVHFASLMLPWCTRKREQLELLIQSVSSHSREKIVLRQSMRLLNNTSPKLPVHFTSWQQFAGYIDARNSVCIDGLGNIQLRSDCNSHDCAISILNFLVDSDVPCGRLAYLPSSHRCSWICSRRTDLLILLQKLLPHVVESKAKFEVILSHCPSSNAQLSRTSRLRARQNLFILNGSSSVFCRGDQDYVLMKKSYVALYKKMLANNTLKSLDTIAEDVKMLKDNMEAHKLRTQTRAMLFFLRHKISKGSYFCS